MDEITDGPRIGGGSEGATEGGRGRAAFVLFLLVFVACLFGIYTRPLGFLANLWPANAIMLAFLLRNPESRGWLSWLAGAAAYLAADLLTGATLAKALLLNSANLAGIASAAAVYARLPADMIRLRQPASMLYLVFAVAIGSAMAGLIGAVANPWLFGRSLLSGWIFWFATEFVNYVTILPLLLSAPAPGAFRAAVRDGLRALPHGGRPAGRRAGAVLPARGDRRRTRRDRLSGSGPAVVRSDLSRLWRRPVDLSLWQLGAGRARRAEPAPMPK